MYQIDANINTAIERQIEHVRAVKAYGSFDDGERSSRSWTRLALAVAAPVALLLVLGLMLH